MRTIVGFLSALGVGTIMLMSLAGGGAAAIGGQQLGPSTITTKPKQPTTTSSTTTVPTSPSTTQAPTTTTTRPPTTTTTTTLPFSSLVSRDCADYEGDDALAGELAEAKGGNGSEYLVILAENCGVQFSEEAPVRPELDRPWSNLEYAVNEGDDPYFSKSYDDVTANEAQADLVMKASTDQWYELNPNLRPTTVPRTTQPKRTTTTTKQGTVPQTGPKTSTSVPGSGSIVLDDDGERPGEGDGDGGGGGEALQMFGAMLAGVGAAAWGVLGVRSNQGEVPEYVGGDLGDDNTSIVPETENSGGSGGDN